jgi:hypothetical protein
MRRLTYLFGWTLAGAILLTSLASASTPTPGRKPWDSEDGTSPTEVTQTLKVHVTELLGPGKLRVVDPEEEREHVLQLGDTLEIRAQDKKMFDGRKKLTLGDLRPGHQLKLTFLAEDGRLLRILVLKAKG